MRQMNFKEAGNGVVYLTSRFFARDGVTIAFSTRFGGVSPFPFNSLNLGLSVPDSKENVIENRLRFVSALGGDCENVVLGEQVHGCKVEKVNEPGSEEILKGEAPGIGETDGLITKVPNIPLMGSFADCVPIFLLEPGIPIAGLIHAGWRGSFKEIAKKAVRMMQEMGGKPDRIKAILGPSIGPCCYQVGKEIYNQAVEIGHPLQVFAFKGQNMFLNLWQLNTNQLIRSGVLEKNIINSQICTCCENDIFFSYRKGYHNTGRMMGMIFLN